MATVHAVLARVKGRANTGSTMPVIDAVPISAKTATTTSSWVEVSSITAPDLDCFWDITEIAGAVCRVFFGDSAPSGNDVGHAIPAGGFKHFSPNAIGEKLFIKDAT